jgi:hypothetical protein
MAFSLEIELPMKEGLSLPSPYTYNIWQLIWPVARQNFRNQLMGWIATHDDWLHTPADVAWPFICKQKLAKKNVKYNINYQKSYMFFLVIQPIAMYINLSICLGLWSVCGFRNAVRNWDKAHRRLVVYSKVNEAPVSGAWLENPRNRESIGIIWDPCLKNRTI